MVVKSYFSKPEIVAKFAAATDLQPPESTILSELADWLPGKTMLDIGVGAGRTTSHFGSLVLRYVGIDLSPRMIATCEQRFRALNGEASIQNRHEFLVADVRDMRMFEDSTFDFVLFSYNGISHLWGAERTAALQEINRVAKPGAYFCFSAHNLQHLDRVSLSLRRHLTKDLRTLFRKRRIQKMMRWAGSRLIHNRHLYRQKLKNTQSTIVYFKRLGLVFGMCYIRPGEQLRQLEKGFTDVRVFSLTSGDELARHEVDSTKDEWLYYLCTVA